MTDQAHGTTTATRVDHTAAAESNDPVEGLSADTVGVRVAELGKVFGGAGGQSRAALQRVSLDIRSGEFFSLVGPSGCGKTTLLRCIAGLEQPISGVIQIGSDVVFSPTRQVSPELREIGMVFQSYAIWPHMTVEKNAEFALRHGRKSLRQPKAERESSVRATLEEFGLAEYVKAWPGQLSGGQQQRLALARAMLGRPRVMLMDEPLSNLDAKLREEMRRVLRDFHRASGATTIYVTHDRHEALALSDRIAIMSAGQVVQVGTPNELYHQPAEKFVADFICDSNLVPGRVSALSGGVATVEVPWGQIRSDCPAGVAVADEVWLSIRPATLRVQAAGDGSEALPTAHRMNGTVTDREYLGDAVHYEVDVSGVKIRANGTTQTSAEVGDRIEMTVRESEVQLMRH